MSLTAPMARSEAERRRGGGGRVRYLVRHADAGDKRAWGGPDDDRPLSDLGQREAHALVELLAGYPVGEIVSSPAVRCVQTVQPLADRHRLDVRVDGALSVDAELELPMSMLLDPDRDGMVLCTHGELIKPLLSKLHDLGAPIGERVRAPKGSVWVLDSVNGSVARASYLPPPGRA
jgi:8-oxo-dGTP diphosphatase